MYYQNDNKFSLYLELFGLDDIRFTKSFMTFEV